MVRARSSAGHHGPDDCGRVTKAMLGFRRHLSWAICGWLASQIVGIVAAPALVWQLTASQVDQACDCPLGPGQACPMHQGGTHDGKHDSKQDTPTCKLRNAFPASDAAMFSQSGAFGILPRPMVALTVFHPGVLVHARTPVAIAHAYLPEAPPPRA